MVSAKALSDEMRALLGRRFTSKIPLAIASARGYGCTHPPA